jgi:hypothetical protein
MLKPESYQNFNLTLGEFRMLPTILSEVAYSNIKIGSNPSNSKQDRRLADAMFDDASQKISQRIAAAENPDSEIGAGNKYPIKLKEKTQVFMTRAVSAAIEHRSKLAIEPEPRKPIGQLYEEINVLKGLQLVLIEDKAEYFPRTLQEAYIA